VIETTPVTTPDAPRAIGPYSQAVDVRIVSAAVPGAATSRFVFASGQIPLDPATGELVEGGIEEQTRRVMENLKAVLLAAGAKPDPFGPVVKTTVYLVDLGDFAKVNEVYASYFRSHAPPPARATVQVAALPRGARVEIDAIAVLE
jgi:2-iminobutanoate/2-iminopropanoate deaminase